MPGPSELFAVGHYEVISVFTASTTWSGPHSFAFHSPEPAPEPKKPVEVPILTFGKRRINLKDVA